MSSSIADFFKSGSPLKATLLKDSSGNPTDQSLQVATAVVLLEVAGADGEAGEQEAQALCELLSQEFGILEEDLPELVSIALAARNERDRVEEFIDCIAENFSNVQKQKILAMIWKVVIADGRVDDFEKKFSDNLKFRFRVDKKDAEKARKIAEEGRV